MASFHLSVKVGKRGTGGAHADYVQRAGAYKNYRGGEELAFTESVNMPIWSAHSPSEFFRQADLNERANGSSYREYEIALPRELSHEQRIEFVREFVRQEIGKDHPCTWAIHNPKASIEGGDQPHAHIMFSDRKLDGIERNPEQFFKRANSKAPEKGGCAKANTAASKAERKEKLVGLRERFATLQNAHLAKHGHADRVTHQSLDAQGIARQPERHLGPVAVREQNTQLDVRLYRAAHRRAAEAEKAVKQIDLPGRIKAIKQEQRHEQQAERRQRGRHRPERSADRPALRDVRRIDDLPRSRDQERLLQRDERHHLEQRRLADEQAARRVHELDTERKRDQWRERLTDRRQAWQAKPAMQADQAKPGKPVIYRWSAGKAAGFAAVKDYGDRIVPCGKPEAKVSDAKIGAMLAVAREKGWKELAFTGPAEFRLRCAAAAVAKGFTLADADLAQKLTPAPNRTPRPAPTPATATARAVSSNAVAAPAAQPEAEAKAAAAFAAKVVGLKEANKHELALGTCIEVNGDRAIYHLGRGVHVVGPAPDPLSLADKGKGKGGIAG